jgi:hypothetical protein
MYKAGQYFTSRKSLCVIGLLGLASLGGCASYADPEPFMGFECTQLRAMSERAAPIDPFAANRVGPSPQAGLTGDREGLKTGDNDFVEAQEERSRSIAAAYRQKGC